MSTLLIILVTPSADRMTPVRITAVDWRIAKGVKAWWNDNPEKYATMDKAGTSMAAVNLLQSATLGIENIVRNLTGREVTRVIRKPSAHRLGELKAEPMAEASGSKTRSGAQQSNSTPMSLLKLRTVSPRREASEFSNSPNSDGRIMTVVGMMKVGASSSPDRGKARIAERNTTVQKMDTTCAVVGKLILRMKLKA